MQGPGANHFLQIILDPDDTVINLPAIRFNLAFTGTTKKAVAPPLAFQMGPGPDKTGPLIGQRSQFNLHPAFPRGCTLSEDFQNQGRPVDNLTFPGFFQITLLDGREGTIHDDQADFIGLDLRSDLLNDTAADQGSRSSP